MRRLLIPILVAAISVSAFAAPKITQKDKDKAADLVSKMTLQEKVDLISGKIDGFHTAEIARLGIPSVRMADGPQGVRNKTKSTFYPSGIATAATWNRAAAKGVGEGIASDAKARGVGIMLGPGVNIYRSALCGRNFEYYGEDPYLTGEIAASYIIGMQDQGVMATIKHFAVNNQEFDRHGTGSNVDERTANEIYFAAFRKAVEKADVACVMTSYNPLNGTHAAENPWLIKDNLRAWGFDGIVMSDWTSTYDPLLFMYSGIDFEMPKVYVTKYEVIKEMIDNGVLPEAVLDEKCIHILQAFSAYGFLDGKEIGDKSIPEDNPESDAKAYEVAKEAPVLLKNEGGILPLLPSKKGNIVLIGPNAHLIPCGGGSGIVHPIDGRAISLAEGLKKLGKGYNVTFLDNPDPAVLSKASAVIVSVGFDSPTEGEGHDRTYSLPKGQDGLIETVLGYNPNVIVVANSGGEFDVSKWIDKVPAVLLAWYTGQEGGKALAEILTGKVSPSGKLPFTFWGALDKNPADKWYRPVRYLTGKDNRDPLKQVDYVEGVFLGYRGVEHFGLKPLFPFGFGLSYSSFDYSGLEVKPAGDGFELSFTVRNTGKKEASEVAQVYVAPVDPSLHRPARELKGFEKVSLAPGASALVKVALGRDAFARYDILSHGWTVDSGSYRIEVGSSSADILLKTDVKL